ncbi:MAG: ACP phosphodiesterase [Saprospiraceae bacterium]
MNFLAHVFLSQHDEELLVGNFIGDFVRKSEDKNYPVGVQRGLELHRKIDAFTDNHIIVRESTRLLHERHHKYAPVLLDVYYDFLLARNWEQFSERNLQDFTQNVYTILEKYLPIMPPILQHRVPLMIADDWLVQYGKLEGLEFTFSRMKRRASEPSHFDHAVETLQIHLEPLEAGFLQFFPEAVTVAKL